MLTSAAIVFVSIILSFTTAQTIPLTWQKQDITVSRADIVQRVEAAIAQYWNTLPPPANIKQSNDLASLAQICIQMSDYDALTGQSKYKQALTGYISAAERVKPRFVYDVTRVGIGFGYAAARAYETYGDEFFLESAKLAWESGRRLTISNEDIGAGAVVAKNFTLQVSCRDASLAGGTFRVRPFVYTLLVDWKLPRASIPMHCSTVPKSRFFSSLSAYLYGLTLDETYLSAARTTASFLRNQMYRSENRLFATSLSAREQDNCRVTSRTTGYENAVVLQGMSLLNKATNSAEYTTVINDVVVGIASNTNWHNNAGIMSGTDVSGTYIPRGMVQVYNATTDAALRNYISAYMSIQYNAVVDNAAGDGNIYGPSWTNRASSIKYDGRGQSKAISALLAAIVPFSRNSASTGLPSPTSTPASSESVENKNTAPVGAIVGGVIGGLAFLGILVALGLWFIRRRNQKEPEPSITSYTYSTVASGPTSTMGTYQTDIHPQQTISQNQYMETRGAWDAPPSYSPGR
ncbi:hypothetical protein VNI00_009544 [Paramarasmius palmivorus]|uniref:Uncharacterized protein n=1 Tax=Paramarasmius palmivorus TaxID=297713 RepID=A0AAW0CRL6_9AGAR